MTEVDRAEHLAWAKARALEYVQRGELGDAVGSMVSDLRKHTAWSDTPTLGFLMLAVQPAVKRGDRGEVRRWVEGFN
jgi:hypothetical protein